MRKISPYSIIYTFMRSIVLSLLLCIQVPAFGIQPPRNNKTQDTTDDKECLWGKDLFDTSLQSFTKPIPNILDEEGDSLCWQQGRYIEGNNFDIAFLRYYYLEHSLLKAEDITCSYYLVTYSKEGNIIDFKRVGKSGLTNILSTKFHLGKLRITSRHAYLQERSAYSDYWPMEFIEERTSFYISPTGQITSKKNGKAKKIKVSQQHPNLKSFTFENYIALFKPETSLQIQDDYFYCNNALDNQEISYYNVWKFIDSTYDGRDNAMWIAGKHIRTKDLYLCFATKLNLTPLWGYPYSERLVITYTPSGKLIGKWSVAKTGDEYKYDFTSSDEPLTFSITQHALPIDTCKTPSCSKTHYYINKDGFLQSFQYWQK